MKGRSVHAEIYLQSPLTGKARGLVAGQRSGPRPPCAEEAGKGSCHVVRGPLEALVLPQAGGGPCEGRSWWGRRGLPTVGAASRVLSPSLLGLESGW